ncbi:Helicase associated domain protein [Specibacter sp. RAF43]|uniref:Helicase associated domain protein n=1 Tax=Specibacter sp. RAF43 TaxID=3233057 RepID=UPI003F9CA87F
MDVLGDWITTDLEFTNDTRWRQRLDELVDFQKAEHHLPSRRHFKSKHEDVLGIWWQTQVSNRNRGTMPAWRLEAMNEAFPGWAQ